MFLFEHFLTIYYIPDDAVAAASKEIQAAVLWKHKITVLCLAVLWRQGWRLGNLPGEKDNMN